MLDDQTKSPETIKEVGIHLGYISKDVAELKELIKEQSNHFVTIETIDSLKAEAAEEHKTFRAEIDALMTKTTSYPLIEKIVFSAVGMVLIAVVGALIGLVVIKV